jgi:hypothetical protein
MDPRTLSNQGTVLIMPSMVMWLCTPLMAGCSTPLTRLLKSFPNPTSPMTSKLKNMDHDDMSIGLPSLLDSCDLKRSAFALIRGSYVLIAVASQRSNIINEHGSLTFDREATIPSPPPQAVVVKVTCHMNRTLLWIVARLAVPGRLQTLRIWPVEQRHCFSPQDADFTWTYLCSVSCATLSHSVLPHLFEQSHRNGGASLRAPCST